MADPLAARLVHRTAHLRLRLTHRQARRCHGLLRSAGDVWAWLLDSNRQRRQQGERPVAGVSGAVPLRTPGADRHTVVGDPTGITKRDAGRVQNWRLRHWRRTHLVQALRDKAELAGIAVRLVDERGTSSTCPACRRRASKPGGRRFSCPECRFKGHRDLVGAANIAAQGGGGPDAATSTTCGGGPAWPRATHPTILRCVGVARHESPT